MDVSDRKQSPHSTEMSILSSIVMGSKVGEVPNENEKGSGRERNRYAIQRASGPASKETGPVRNYTLAPRRNRGALSIALSREISKQRA